MIVGGKRRINYPLYVYHEDPDGVVGIEQNIKPSMLAEKSLVKAAKKLAANAEKVMRRYYEGIKGSGADSLATYFRNQKSEKRELLS